MARTWQSRSVSLRLQVQRLSLPFSTVFSHRFCPGCSHLLSPSKQILPAHAPNFQLDTWRALPSTQSVRPLCGVRGASGGLSLCPPRPPTGGPRPPGGCPLTIPVSKAVSMLGIPTEPEEDGSRQRRPAPPPRAHPPWDSTHQLALLSVTGWELGLRTRDTGQVLF